MAQSKEGRSVGLTPFRWFPADRGNTPAKAPERATTERSAAEHAKRRTSVNDTRGDGYSDPREDPDVERMLRVRAGDDEAFQELVLKNGEWLLGLAYRLLGTRARSEEIVQEAFLRIFRAAERYEPKARFRTYASRVVVNLCYNELRRAERDTMVETPRDAEEDGNPNPFARHEPKAPSSHQMLVGREVQRRVEVAISGLPSSQKTALLLTRFDGYSYQEVADVLETTTDAVKALVARATRRLKTELEDLLDEKS